MYVVDGWGDPYENIIGELLANLKVPRKGLIGPWGHIFPNLATPLGLDWPYEEVRWWQQWLEGASTGIMDEPMLRVYMMAKADSEAFPAEVPGRWVAEEVWPSQRIASSSLYLDAGGRLSPKPGSREHVKYVGDKVVGLTKPQWVYGRPTEFEQSPDDRNSLVFDSAPLDRDLEILGYPIAKIRVGADVPIAQLAVRLTEVTPEGQSWLVTYNVLNLTRRDSMEAPTPLEQGRVLRRRTAALPDRSPIQEGKPDPNGDLGELVAADLAVAADCDTGYRARCFAPRASRPPRPAEGGTFHHSGHPRGSPRCQIRPRICQRSELGEDAARGSQASPDADSRCGRTYPVRQ